MYFTYFKKIVKTFYSLLFLKMLLGHYSLHHYTKLREKQKNGERLCSQEDMVWFMVNFLIWTIALVALVYSWNKLDSAVQVIGVVGLLFGSFGATITLLAILFSQAQVSYRRF